MRDDQDEGGRGRGIRTPDILLPKQARYQTALYPDLLCADLRCLLGLYSIFPQSAIGIAVVTAALGLVILGSSDLLGLVILGSSDL
jgi:hypothetical protein